MREIDPDKVREEAAAAAALAEQAGARGRKLAFGCMLYGLPLLFGLSCIGGSAVYAYLALIADATIYVHNPSGDVEVVLDGEPYVQIGGAQIHEMSIERGHHEVRIDRAGQSRTITRDFTGFDDLLVSADPTVCFAQLNVASALYTSGRTLSPRTGCAFRVGEVPVYERCEEPCDIGTAALRIADLPDSVEGTKPVTLMAPYACIEGDSVDGAVLLGRMLGCAPRP